LREFFHPHGRALQTLRHGRHLKRIIEQFAQ
jgi:hypothetical protein